MKSVIEEVKRGERVERWVAIITAPNGAHFELSAYDEKSLSWLRFVTDACNQAAPAPAGQPAKDRCLTCDGAPPHCTDAPCKPDA